MHPTSQQRLRSALFDGLVSLAVAGLTSLGPLINGAPRPTMLLGYLMAVVLLVRRRRPLVAMAVVSLAALAQVVLFPHGIDPLPYDIAVLIGMYSVVKYAPRMLGAWLAAATVAIGIAIEVVRNANGKNWWTMAIWYAGVCGGVWLMAYTVRSRQAYVRSLEERAATLERERQHLAQIAVANERADIARELHDVVAHSLAVMIVQADGGRYAFDSDPAQARAALSTVAATGREALEDMRRLVRVLRGADDAVARDEDVLGEGADDRRRLTIEGLGAIAARARSAGLSVELEVGGERAELTPALELAAYRIVQEALTNVLRHAGRHANVRLRVRYGPEVLEVSIVDDGGERPAGAPAERGEAGNGLIGMRERVAVHGGRMEAGPRLDGGWSVEVCLPLGGAAEQEAR
ncbi:sensor histidine kinase [Dactylosporangium sp. NPDC048998]|uniref:sensor histidine kinase n=1 Tax=Dactylosporangium sp. NPDC048998 TaxID=3363976 RepID=UPI00371FFBDA